MTDTMSAKRLLYAIRKNINKEHRLAEQAATNAVLHAMNAGALLIEARGHCPRGTWGQWLANHFEGSERTAQAYMRVAARVPQLSDDQRAELCGLSFRETLRYLSEQRGCSIAESADGLVDAAKAFVLEQGYEYVALIDGGTVDGFAEVIPSASYPGYWYIAQLTGNAEGGGVDYTKRPIKLTQELLPHVLSACIDYRIVSPWVKQPCPGREPWYVTGQEPWDSDGGILPDELIEIADQRGMVFGSVAANAS